MKLSELKQIIKEELQKVLQEAKQQKPDFLDLDKDGNKTEPMKKAAKEVGKKTASDSEEEDLEEGYYGRGRSSWGPSTKYRSSYNPEWHARRSDKGDEAWGGMKEFFAPDPTESLSEYPTGGPGRPHKLYTGGVDKPELKGKKYAERVEIWKAADPEWGEWYDRNFEKAKVGQSDSNFKAWVKSWNTKSKFHGKWDNETK